MKDLLAKDDLMYANTRSTYEIGDVIRTKSGFFRITGPTFPADRPGTCWIPVEPAPADSFVNWDFTVNDAIRHTRS